MSPSDVEVKATLPIVQDEDFRVGKFPIDRLAQRNARRELRSMKISGAHESFVDANRDAMDHNPVTQRALREPKRVQAVQ